MSAPFVQHPRFAMFREQFRCHPEWFTPWTGTLFRFQSVYYPTTLDVISGEGAAWRGGRWNPPGIPTVYGSSSDSTALEECKANDRYYGIVTKAPRLLVAIEAELSRVVDLRDATVRRALGITVKELSSEDWRKLSAAGKESFTQTIGRAVAESGASALIASSASVKGVVNIAVFPRAGMADRLTVVDGATLDKWRSKTGG